ncbi:MAG: PEGA domain-containing protein [bacterium]|nr:PEGA domain-containing protein [bacterium]
MKISHQRILIAVVSFILLIGLTILGVQFSQGYRFNFRQGKVEITGLLVVKSQPPAAKVFLNGKLSAASDASLSLPKNEYEIKLVKPGYQPWVKKLTVDKGLVTQVDAKLWPISPDLSKITYAGALYPVLSPSKSEIVFVLPDSEAVVEWQLQPGLYVLDLSSKGFLGKKGSRLIAADTRQVKFNQVKQLIWSPDGSKIMAVFDDRVFLLSTKDVQENTPLLDVSYQKDEIEKTWNKQRNQQLKAVFEKIKPPLRNQLLSVIKVIDISSDESKVAYQATGSAQLAQVIQPPLPPNSHLPEVRNIKTGNYYVYDIREDKNYLLAPQKDVGKDVYIWWMVGSSHLLMVYPGKIYVIEYDGGNKTMVFAGNFQSKYVFPHLSGEDIIVLTSLNPTQPNFYNLYNLSLR